MTSTWSETGITTEEFADRVRRNQENLGTEMKAHYDFIVCGSGSSGSVVARRLAENPDVSVLVLEAGGSDEAPETLRPEMWLANLGSERDWNFTAEPSCHLNGRAIPYSMGKVLGGGSSINVMVWARGHKNDWDYFAAEAKDERWSYESVLAIYRDIEDWHGTADPDHRGTGGPVYVESASNPSPIATEGLVAADLLGIPTFDHQNGSLMESDGGASIVDLRIRNGYRQSVFRSYLFPLMDRPNVTVLSGALVTRVRFDKASGGWAATGVEFVHDGKLHRVSAGSEVVLSLGAIHTPKVLMQSGIGDRAELRHHGIPVVQHLPGVGRNLQDHPAFSCVWESKTPLPWRNSGGEMTVFAKSDSSLDTPDLQAYQLEFPYSSRENAAKIVLPESGWAMLGAVVRPKSRGRIYLTGPDPLDTVRIHANLMSHPDDIKAAIACIELCREIGNSAALRPFSKREVMPGNLNHVQLERFIRTDVTTYHHQTCTAKMGNDNMSVVDGSLKVYGVQNLRIADGSIMPRVTTGNTMAPCVIIGERAGQILRERHAL
ncbi:choline dehydrogenase [Mycobacterium montefiorense]|uniref:Choline dehydrogenase n=2 Tax=Mycobacterium montefiorense TaxID=154654 RepID=A0AA37PK37_9MYCO|nr:choline dehydrogenase [Mycobacterium montefiorense]GKU34536.1 choline dehydrogenase [Mycobacterium montefiorense]GKU39157.1 choline dehydrogenase [Mycobacterium montefiorense]GKU43582.1 choline dehydrogenase [Mycobacterium montefiorense]GKU49922.1 choline dehydrogenase [Mycobacterium montefiorense]